MAKLQELLARKDVLMADGATGTNLFQMGLTAGDPPELWNADHPDRIRKLHDGFLGAGSDIILTNTFGANRFRMKLHNAQDRVFELNKLAAEIAREAADATGREVVVAGSMGPTGELFTPLGELTMEAAVEAFTEQAKGLKAGGADICWIETMSSVEEIRAAAEGAINAGMPYTATASFDTAGRTMMGLKPEDLAKVFDGLSQTPEAFGANCGVGASDLLVSVLAMEAQKNGFTVIAKANCGIPQVKGDHVHYSGTPELMASYTHLAMDAGARIVGGCCGTTPEHLVAIRTAIDSHNRGERPDRAHIEELIGPLVAPPREEGGEGRKRTGRRERA
ncbi:betaine--homocysteine S-methyltransferase [Afifella sp. JA880]|uniref:betaine--homocysteine S-methyltransferase n=1 Tax=Afifella sp. JA880 TaxID=2975280 RepID=UPI0021BB35F9|nr:betaine--homocysteine S-methyltransferase [Afifella sp. JA880]MCT8266680.1 betaine--homocysteine S-methyltransferase [Afifella sp. JA880]